MYQEESVILVDAENRETGVAGKMDAHRRGLMHRAISVMVWDARGRFLMQKRAVGKYHSGGLWSNACCSHPRPNEDALAAASRRLHEEMGFSCPLSPLGTIAYRADVGSSLIENELVHVFRGVYDGPIRPNPEECDGYAWITASDVRAALEVAPQRYTVWFAKYVAEGWLVPAV